jgi:hypothetical protein
MRLRTVPLALHIGFVVRLDPMAGPFIARFTG